MKEEDTTSKLRLS